MNSLMQLQFTEVMSLGILTSNWYFAFSFNLESASCHAGRRSHNLDSELHKLNLLPFVLILQLFLLMN